MVHKMTAHLQWQKRGAKSDTRSYCLPDKSKLEQDKMMETAPEEPVQKVKSTRHC
jgi:hypothetical protein